MAAAPNAAPVDGGMDGVPVGTAGGPGSVGVENGVPCGRGVGCGGGLGCGVWDGDGVAGLVAG